MPIGDHADPDLRQHDQQEGLPAGGAVGHGAHLDVPGHRVEKALHHEDREGQLQRRDDQHDAGQRVEQPDPVHQQEDRDDQRHRREGVQDQQALEIAGAAGEIVARQVVAGERADAQHQRHLHHRQDQRVAEGHPDAGNLAPMPEAPFSVSAMSGSTGTASCRGGDRARSATASRATVDDRKRDLQRAAAAGPLECQPQHRPEEQRRQHDASVRHSTSVLAPVRPENATVTSQR